MAKKKDQTRYIAGDLTIIPADEKAKTGERRFYPVTLQTDKISKVHQECATAEEAEIVAAELNLTLAENNGDEKAVEDLTEKLAELKPTPEGEPSQEEAKESDEPEKVLRPPYSWKGDKDPYEGQPYLTDEEIKNGFKPPVIEEAPKEEKKTQKQKAEPSDASA